MRINKFVAQATGLSRRAADQAIREGRVVINQAAASLGDNVAEDDKVSLDGRQLHATNQLAVMMLNKPPGYVCSRAGQGSRTVYDLLPSEYHRLKPVGRLDKDSSGLLLLTDDGQLANQLTHPSYNKAKVYEAKLDKPLAAAARQQLSGPGVQLEDGLSRLALEPLDEGGKAWRITMSEGRNRQIRRSFAALGYQVNILHRTRFGSYRLGDLEPGRFAMLDIAHD